MKTIIKSRWAIFFIWLVATLLLTVFQPDVNKILLQKGQTPLNSDSPSVQADAMSLYNESLIVLSSLKPAFYEDYVK